MKVKPKEALLNLPMVLQFSTIDELNQLASNINQFIHGKVKIKYDELGYLNDNIIAIFYFQRNNEYTELKDSFMVLIDQEEMEDKLTKPLDSRESSVLAMLAQDPKQSKYTIYACLDSLTGDALLIGRVITGEINNAPARIIREANRIIDWAESLKEGVPNDF